MKRYKLGLIGLGKFGKNYVETIKNHFPNVELSIACRKTNERPNFLPQDCQFTNHWENVIYSKINGIIIAADPGLHYQAGLKALHYNIPVLVEKPAVEYIAEATYLQEISIQNKTPILVNYIHLFSPHFIELKRQILIKGILSINSININNGPFRDFSPLLDYLPHELAMGLSLTNPNYKNIIIEEVKQLNNGNKGKLYEITINYDGIRHHIKVGNGAEDKIRSFQVFTNLNNDKFNYFQFKANNYLVHKDGKTIYDSDFIYPENQQTPLQGTIQCFLDLIDGKKDKRANFEMTVQITKIIEEIAKIVD